MNLHEEMFARNFIVSARRERYLTLLGTEKGRFKLVFDLNHCSDIDKRFATPVPVGQQYVGSILNALRLKGAPDLC